MPKSSADNKRIGRRSQGSGTASTHISEAFHPTGHPPYSHLVIPAQAGNQTVGELGSRLRGSDGFGVCHNLGCSCGSVCAQGTINKYYVPEFYVPEFSIFQMVINSSPLTAKMFSRGWNRSFVLS